jgi:hypothetical protein
VARVGLRDLAPLLEAISSKLAQHFQQPIAAETLGRIINLHQ